MIITRIGKQFISNLKRSMDGLEGHVEKQPGVGEVVSGYDTQRLVTVQILERCTVGEIAKIARNDFVLSPLSKFHRPPSILPAENRDNILYQIGIPVSHLPAPIPLKL